MDPTPSSISSSIHRGPDTKSFIVKLKPTCTLKLHMPRFSPPTHKQKSYAVWVHVILQGLARCNYDGGLILFRKNVLAPGLVSLGVAYFNTRISSNPR